MLQQAFDFGTGQMCLRVEHVTCGLNPRAHTCSSRPIPGRRIYANHAVSRHNLAEAMGLTMAGGTAHKPTDTDFNASVAKLRDAGCDMIVMGTIVKDTTIILQTARKMGWDVDFLGNFACYSTAVAEAPGGPAEGFFAMAPALYAYPDDPRPAVHALAERYKKTYGFDINYLGEAGYTAATFMVAVLEKAGRDQTPDSFTNAMESMQDWRDVFNGPPLSMSPTSHHASSQSFLSVVKNARWTPLVPEPLSF
jgi:branched-chain amino acid transport system substrate-binding protein